jgi:mannose-6-phosphate isomerase-like protein (cupin superfamily)
MAWDTGASTVIRPDEGQSFWQPAPTGGYVTIKVAPPHFPSNLYAVGIQSVPPGGVIPLHAHARAEEMLYVVSGTTSAVVDGISHDMGPGSLLYAGRWVQHGFTNTGDTNLVLYFVIWPPGLDLALAAIGQQRDIGETYPHVSTWTNESSFESLLAPAHFAPTAGSTITTSPETPPGPCILLGPHQGESFWQPSPTDGYATVKLSPRNLASNHVTVVEQIVPPGKRLPAHGHPKNEELKFIATGTGIATVNGIDYPIEPGSLCVTGRWVEHSFFNTGSEDLTILAVFQPPALEGLIEAIGRPRAIGEPAPTSFEAPEDIVQIAATNSLALPHQIAAHQRRDVA